ncbi:MAG: hypothetical protein EOO77_20340 [Oxalobacteraceae bacterium]|nr:MAG: hypothetical protein EOO77_20340 [Oxalobacteraceae bacterium]
MQVQSLYMIAVIVSIAVAAVAKLILLKRPHYDNRLLERRQDAILYAASKLAPVLAVAFAVAADANSRTSMLNAAVGVGGLIFVAGLTTWSIYARFTGQFFGWAHKLRPN